MDKVLIISYNYIPYNVTGSFRVMRFVKYLPKYGIAPVIVTANQGEHHINKNLVKNIPSEAVIYRFKSLFKDSQERISISEKYYKKNAGFIKNTRNYLILLLKDFIFSPDIQILWCLQHFWKIVKIIKMHKISHVFITGGPFSLFILGVALKKTLGVKILLDFRDPWSDYIHQRSQTAIRQFHNKWMENLVVANGDAIISVTEPIVRSLKNKNINIPMKVIPNGFDPDDYTSLRANDNRLIFTFIYAGKFNLLDNSYNPELLLLAYKKFYETNKINDVELFIIAHVNIETKNLLKKMGIKNIKIIEFMPRDELLTVYNRANAFIQFTYPEKLELAISIKLFEYSQYRKPILSITSNSGCTADFLKKTRLGNSCNNDNVNEISNLFLKSYSMDLDVFRKNINLNEIEKYNVINQTEILANLIKSLK